MLIIEMDKLFQHAHEHGSLIYCKRLKDASLRSLNGRFNVVDELPSSGSDVQQLCPTIVCTRRAPDEFLALQPSDHFSNSRTVEGNNVAEGGLIDARMIVDCKNC